MAQFVRMCGSAVLATTAPGGAPQAALVGVAMVDTGEIILDTPRQSRKIRNLSSERRVALVVVFGDVSLQIEGAARVVEGAERESFGAAYNEAFPGSRALTAGFDVVVVQPTWVRVYDAGSSPAVVTESVWGEAPSPSPAPGGTPL